MWEVLSVFFINSIIAFFVFLATMKMAIMTNPDFGFWLTNKMEEMRDRLEEEQQELEKERKRQKEAHSKLDMDEKVNTNKSDE